MPAVKKQLVAKGPKSPKAPVNFASKTGGLGDEQLSIELMPIDKLVPYANNARTHPPEQVKQIAASIKEFGFITPVVVDRNNVLIAGHGRVLGSKELGLKQIPAIRAEHLTDAQVAALRLADNKIALNSDWLDDLLKNEMLLLQSLDFDLSLTGFDDDEIEKLLNAKLPGDGEGGGVAKNMLADKFMIPPFSVLNAREGWWQERKRQWIELGIQSELGRGATDGNLGRDNGAPGGGGGGAWAARGRKPNAVPGGAPMPLDRAKNKARANA